jgi:ABC-2 type transport system ATP-binding protein
MIMSILVPDEGRVVLFGSGGTGRDNSERVGYLPEERGLYKAMKVLDHLVFLGETKGVGRKAAAEKAHRWLERLGLREWKGRKVEDLSKGMQQKVQFIGALLHDPELVILDEPFSGLDPVNSQVMKDVVVEIARSNRTVLFSTHIMEQAEKMCDRIAIIARGEKVLDGSLAEIKRSSGQRNVVVSFHRDAARALRVLQDRSLVARMDDYGAAAELELAPGADPDRLLRHLVDSGAGLRRFEVVEPSLQSIFVAKAGAEAASTPMIGEVVGS